VLKVTLQVATPGAVSAVYHCLVAMTIDVKKRSNKNSENVKNVKKRDKNKKNVCKRYKTSLFSVVQLHA